MEVHTAITFGVTQVNKHNMIHYITRSIAHGAVVNIAVVVAGVVVAPAFELFDGREASVGFGSGRVRLVALGVEELLAVEEVLVV